MLISVVLAVRLSHAVPLLLSVTHRQRHGLRLSHIHFVANAQRLYNGVGLRIGLLVGDGIALCVWVRLAQRLGLFKPFGLALRLGLSYVFCVRVRVVFGDHLP